MRRNPMSLWSAAPAGLMSAAVAAVAALCLDSAAAQDDGPTGEAESMPTQEEWSAPRVSNGRPDLQGVWTNKTIIPLERPKELGNQAFFTPEEAEEFARERLEQTDKDNRGSGVQDVLNAYNAFWWDSGDQVLSNMRTSIIVEPRNGRIPPLTPERKAQMQARQKAIEERCDEPGAGCAITNSGELAPASEPEELSLMTRCISFGTVVPMLPTAYNNNYRIVQSPGHVGIVTEMVHQPRIIRTDGGDRSPSALPSDVGQWFGASKGRWEGDTLVVETTNFKGEFFGRLEPATENLRVVERFTRTGPDSLLYRFTVHDPEAWTQPWSGEIPMRRSDGLLYEYACHEGNRGMRNILRAARQETGEGEAGAAAQ